MGSREERLRALPKIDELVRRPALAAAIVSGALPRWAIVEAARAAVDARREAIQRGATDAAPGGEAHEASPSEGPEAPSIDDDALLARARAHARTSLRPVINATGVVLHTNLGRAPLAPEAIEAAVQASRGYATLEYDADARARGTRGVHVAAHLAALTGAEASLVVNNGAAAVLLGLTALATGREVIVSRGELVEIGGSFRVPDVLRLSGATLVEVGTTNKTHPRDVEAAIGERTALLLKVHRSNFAQVGFTEDVDVETLAAIGGSAGVPVLVDLGSGALIDPARLGPGLGHEPTVREVVGAAPDVVTFSGDKLLGGPQAGILVGRAAAIARLAAHPLYRVLRADKLTLAALEATLALHRGDDAATRIPTLRMLGVTVDVLAARAGALIAGHHGRVAVARVDTTSAVGGGSLPTSAPPSIALALAAPDRGADALDAALRAGDPPIVGRIHDGALLLDLRTVAEDELPVLAARLAAL